MFNFNAADLNLDFKAISNDPQLVIIPVNKEYGVIAVVKPLGGGKAACVAFSPATTLENPFQGYRPTFLRKVVTTDMGLRTGSWRALTIDQASTMTLNTAVNALLKDFDKLTPEAVKEIEMHRPTNVSSSPDVSSATYAAPANVQFEKALGHVVGLEFTMARAIAKRNAQAVTKLVAEVDGHIQAPEVKAESQSEIRSEAAPVNESNAVHSSAGRDDQASA